MRQMASSTLWGLYDSNMSPPYQRARGTEKHHIHLHQFPIIALTSNRIDIYQQKEQSRVREKCLRHWKSHFVCLAVSGLFYGATFLNVMHYWSMQSHLRVFPCSCVCIIVLLWAFVYLCICILYLFTECGSHWLDQQFYLARNPHEMLAVCCLLEPSIQSSSIPK